MDCPSPDAELLRLIEQVRLAKQHHIATHIAQAEATQRFVEAQAALLKLSQELERHVASLTRPEVNEAELWERGILLPHAVYQRLN